MTGHFATDKPLKLSVYFSGTGFSISQTRHLAGRLHSLDLAPSHPSPDCDSLKMGFNGCGVDYGLRGLVFGYGLEKQCREVIHVINEYYRQGGNRIFLNCYGHSRGGIAALMLAKALGNVPAEKLSVHLMLVDPVPGNLVITSFLDVFGISLANQVMDLKKCRTLSRVLCLYPCEKLPVLSFHAPLFPDYPPDCDVGEEVIPGCHSDAERLTLTYYRARLFMAASRVEFTRMTDEGNITRYLITAYEEWSTRIQAGKRSGHGSRGVLIVSNPDSQKTYINIHHQALCGLTPDVTQCKLELQVPKTGIRLIKSAFKWLVLGAVLTTVFYLTGCFAWIPGVAFFGAKLGGFVIPVLAPVVAPVLLGIWTSIVRPLIQKFIHPLFTLSEYHYSGSPERSVSALPEGQRSGSYCHIIRSGIIPARHLTVEAYVDKVEQSAVQHQSLPLSGYLPRFSA